MKQISVPCSTYLCVCVCVCVYGVWTNMQIDVQTGYFKIIYFSRVESFYLLTLHIW
jgi:hypothetical protein